MSSFVICESLETQVFLLAVSPGSLSFKMQFRGVDLLLRAAAGGGMLHAAAGGGTSPGGGDDDDDDGPAWHAGPVPAWHAEFDLSPRADRLPRDDEAAKATRVSGDLKSRAISHVVWWNTVALNPHADDMYPLSHLPFAHDTGVHGFHIPAGCCTTMTSFLDNKNNYSAKGWLSMAAREFPGYAGYPYVHSPLGQLATVQSVSAHPSPVGRGNPLSWCAPTFVCPCAAAQDGTRLRQGNVRHCLSWPASGAAVHRGRPRSSRTS